MGFKKKHDFKRALKINISIFLKNVIIKGYIFTFVYYAIIYIEAIYMIQYRNNNPIFSYKLSFSKNLFQILNNLFFPFFYYVENLKGLSFLIAFSN